MSQLPDQIADTHWVHSHEEDNSSGMVFRPSTYNFPRSRGRNGFQLHSDGTAQTSGPGPGDAVETQSANWKIGSGGELNLTDSSSQKAVKYQVVSADPDRLVVKQLP
jgi:hypothetical protein